MKLSTSALKVWEILQPQDKKRFYLILMLNLVSMMLETFSIALVFPLMTSLLQPELLSNNPIIKSFLEAYSPFRGRNFIIFISVMLAFFFMLKNVFSVFLIWVQSKATAQIHLNISSTLLKYYLNLPYLLHVKRNTATLLSNINEQSQNIITFFVQPVIALSSSSVIMLGIIALLFITDLFSLVIISVSLSCSSYFFLKLIKNKLIAIGSTQAKAWKVKNLAVLQSLGGFKETKVLSKEGFFWSQFYEGSKKLNQSSVLSSALNQSLRFFIEFMVVATVLFIIILLLLQGENTESLVIKIAVFSAAALKLLPLILQYTGSFSLFYSGMASVDIIYKDLKELSKYDKKASKKTTKQVVVFKRNIRLKRVSFSYANSEEWLFKNLSFTIEKNKWIAFVGPSGSGKTTLVDLVIGLLSPTKGEILIDGKKRKQEGELWGRGIGYVSQSIYLLDSSIKENVAFGENKENIDTKRVWEVLEIAQLAEFVRGLPHQLNNIIGENGIMLSGGQKQRLGIARALYHRPSLLVLDEATSALDNQTEQQFITALQALKKAQLTVLMIAHRLTTIKDCNVIYCLSEGRVVGKGSYQELKATNKPFQAMLNAR